MLHVVAKAEVRRRESSSKTTPKTTLPTGAYFISYFVSNSSIISVQIIFLSLRLITVILQYDIVNIINMYA